VTWASLLIAAQLAQLVTRVDPEYTIAAREHGIEGSVVIELMVDEKGIPSEFMVGLPLGYGLDEMAVLAVRQWRYKPHKKGKLPATAEVYFNLWRGASPERYHAVEQAMRVLNDPAKDTIDKDEAAFSIRRLASEEFGPALYFRALLHRRGLLVKQDDQAYLKDLHAAAAKRYGSALFDLASVYQDGSLVPKDEARATQFLDWAARAGHRHCAKFLAAHFLTRDKAKAAEYFSLCAIEGDLECQLRLGQLLVENQTSEPRALPYGLAWLEAVKAQGDLSPALLLDQEYAKSPALRDRASKLKAEILKRLRLESP